MEQPVARFTRERRIDWPRILDNLAKGGMSRADIAKEIGISKSSLDGYSNEALTAEPAYWVGHCLVALWCVRCGAQLKDVPIREAQPNVSEVLRESRDNDRVRAARDNRMAEGADALSQLLGTRRR